MLRRWQHIEEKQQSGRPDYLGWGGFLLLLGADIACVLWAGLSAYDYDQDPFTSWIVGYLVCGQSSRHDSGHCPRNRISVSKGASASSRREPTHFYSYPPAAFHHSCLRGFDMGFCRSSNPAKRNLSVAVDYGTRNARRFVIPDTPLRGFGIRTFLCRPLSSCPTDGCAFALVGFCVPTSI